MMTLGRWQSLLTTFPGRIDCPEMRLKTASDVEPPVFTGPGRIEIRTPTTLEFMMYATPRDSHDAFRRIQRARENPHDIAHQFRLFAVDYRGTDWACGWTRPSLASMPRVGFPLVGDLESLSTTVTGPWVAEDSGVELMFSPRLRIPMETALVTRSTIGGEEVSLRRESGQQTIDVLGSRIRFFHSPSDEALWVTAATSQQLQHPFAENWLSEPLRVLLGQLVYPRGVARNLGDGRAHIWLRPSPRTTPSLILSLMESDPLGSRQEFWELYAKYLEFVARGRSETGDPNFDANEVTRFYEEIIQASQVSRWVLSMSLASAAEGIAKALMPKRKGPRVDNYFKDLVAHGVLKRENQRTWRTVRHAVMHGQLTVPWPTEDGDRHLRELADLVHRLTRELIGCRISGTATEHRRASSLAVEGPMCGARTRSAKPCRNRVSRPGVRCRLHQPLTSE